jgi:transcriptional regulator with XRE-family HTH domain
MISKRPARERLSSRRADSHDEEVGRRVRAQRLARRMSQTDLGEKIGVTFQQVQKYERGVNRIGASRLQRVADALDVPVTFFFDATGASRSQSPSLPPSVFETARWTQVARVIKAFNRMKTGKIRQSFVELCELLAERDAGQAAPA